MEPTLKSTITLTDERIIESHLPVDEPGSLARKIPKEGYFDKATTRLQTSTRLVIDPFGPGASSISK